MIEGIGSIQTASTAATQGIEALGSLAFGPRSQSGAKAQAGKVRAASAAGAAGAAGALPEAVEGAARQEAFAGRSASVMLEALEGDQTTHPLQKGEIVRSLGLMGLAGPGGSLAVWPQAMQTMAEPAAKPSLEALAARQSGPLESAVTAATPSGASTVQAQPEMRSAERTYLAGGDAATGMNAAPGQTGGSALAAAISGHTRGEAVNGADSVAVNRQRAASAAYEKVRGPVALAPWGTGIERAV